MADLSVVTMVDSPEHLSEAYRSLEDQTDPNWEWVLVLLERVELPDSLFGDTRVRVLAPTGFVASQGESGCRSLAVEQSRGTHCLELDQHDFLHPEAVARIRKAIESDEPDLLYTDFVDVPVDGLGAERPAELGWETFEVDQPAGGGPVRATRAFPPEPCSLYQPEYAPAVGLTWSRKAFLSLDGPDPTLGNSATFDMVCRAWLAGLPVEHVTDCVVFSRRHAYRYRQADLEATLSYDYAHEMLVEWTRREGLQRLDLGAARNPTPGFTGVDLQDADLNCDIRFGFPVPDGSVGCVRAHDFLEHMAHCPDSACRHGADGGPRCVVGIMNEIYRVLAPGGWLITRTPSTDGRGAFQDPTHCSFWNINSFWYYTRQEQAAFLSGVDCRFQATRLAQLYPSGWHEENHLLYVDADLVALKGQRQPGLCLI